MNERLAHFRHARLDILALLRNIMRNRIGVGILRNVIDSVACKKFGQPVVIADAADHFRVMHLKRNQIAAYADHLHAGRRGDVVAADQGAGMLRIECVLDADRNILHFHLFRRLGMNRLHIHVGKLIGNVEIRIADDLHFVDSDQFRVARGKMKLLVNNAFLGVCENRNLAECNLAVTAVKTLHDAFVIFDVACHDRHFPVEFDILERGKNRFVQRHDIGRHPAGEVDETRVDSVRLENFHGVVCAVRFAESREKFTRGRQVFGRPGMSGAAQECNVFQAFPDGVDTLIHKPVRISDIQADAFKAPVVFEHSFTDFLQCLRPVFVVSCNVPVNSGFTGLFILEKQIGDSGISGNDKHSVVELRAFSGTDDHIVHDFAETAHRSPADFFNGVISHSFRYPQFL